MGIYLEMTGPTPNPGLLIEQPQTIYIILLFFLKDRSTVMKAGFIIYQASKIALHEEDGSARSI